MSQENQISESAMPRPDYPRPQLVRSEWMNLNGEWEFAIDQGKSGRERGLFRTDSPPWEQRILVPFCPESRLSGIAYPDFLQAVWYRRTFRLPEAWREQRVLLHFGAVDYDAEVWVNGVSCGKHRGGYTSFTFNITGLLQQGENTITVLAEDDLRSNLQPRGKQSFRYESKGAHYTRTTGIWQTVWLEPVSQQYIGAIRMEPDLSNGCLHLQARLHGLDGADGEVWSLRAEASLEGHAAGGAAVQVNGMSVRWTLPLQKCRPWSPARPELYDLGLTLLRDGTPVDRVDSYFGMRELRWDGKAVLLNGEPVFQRLVLDQGYYPDGVYTAPTELHMKEDIERAMALGFNGARLHEKVFEPRYLYWADRLGFLVWGEHADWGLDITTPMGLERFLPEWMERVERDANHPSLVAWCAFNETWDRGGRKQDDEVVRTVYRVTKAIDPTRPVIDASGNFHVETDLFDIHDYEQDPAIMRERYAPEAQLHITFPERQQYAGQPYMVSEYGGIWWNPEQAQNKEAWGYGKRPQTIEEVYERLEGLTSALLGNPAVCGFCYTQLYDVEQEVNGLFTYGREPKFDQERIRRIIGAPAALETETKRKG